MESKIIKFRAWDTVRKSFTDSVFLNAIGEVYSDCDPHGVDMSGKRKIAMASPERYILVWWAGETDSNGTEVFTGDIVEWDYEYDSDYDGDMPIVRRSSGRTLIESEKDAWRVREAKSEGGKVFVKGNIYQHPELVSPINR